MPTDKPQPKARAHAQGPDVFPIPGTTKSAHLKQNLEAASIVLTPDDLKEIDASFPKDKVRPPPTPSPPAPTTLLSLIAFAGAERGLRVQVVGDRYAHMALTYHGQTSAAAAH